MEKTTKKPTIGIPGYASADGKSFGAGLNYLNFISHFGNPRIILPWEEKVELDLLLLPGGADLNPTSYGEVPEFSTGNQDVHKQFFFDNRLKNYVNDTPIFGICLGMQQIAAFFGSKLTQHLEYHDQSTSRWSTAHKVEYTPEFTRRNIVKGGKFEVNSHHHQCVLKANLGKDLECTLQVLTEDSPLIALKNNFTPLEKGSAYAMVEGLMHKTLPIFGVQYHPEELYDHYSISIMKHLLNSSKKKGIHVEDALHQSN